jgi:hypothetical protein
MAIESVSSIPPVINRDVPTSRPPETTPDAVQSASRENDARSPRENVSPAAQDTETTLRNSSAQISRAYAGGEPTPADTRAGSEAYRTEATAQDQLAVQKQGNGTRTVDVMA